jgi:hypothetical protein
MARTLTPTYGQRPLIAPIVTQVSACSCADTLAAMGALKRIAPIFPVRDVGVSLEHYARLGFSTREYDQGGYGFVTHGGIEIHLGEVTDDSRAGSGSAYVWVDDADELAQAWNSAGADIRFP